MSPKICIDIADLFFVIFLILAGLGLSMFALLLLAIANDRWHRRRALEPEQLDKS